jgi:hypothetical protein
MIDKEQLEYLETEIEKKWNNCRYWLWQRWHYIISTEEKW